MKKYILIAVFILHTVIVFSQLSQSTVMGIPSGTTAQINSVTPSAQGAMAFNTDTKKMMLYNGTAWVGIDSNNWSLTGNAATTTSNFLGTTDAKDLIFKTNSTEGLRISATQNVTIEKNLRVKGAFQDTSGDAGTLNQILVSTVTGTDWVRNPALDNWLLTGNSGTTSSNFLGTKDDVKMEIRSNNWPMLEFGKRGTLGLTQTYPDYTEINQPLVHLKGDGSISALQFAASGASFYKPMFYTTSNGSFRLKGSAGGTDLFEIGSAGSANNGRLEFIIGDDGGEQMIFKRYDYSSATNKEFFRVQGSVNNTNAKTRFGINLNPTGVPIDGTYDTADTGAMATSTFEVNGSVSKSIFTTTAALALTEDHHTIILGGNHAITLPTASTCKGRIYVIKNPNAYATGISSYINEQGVSNITTINNATTLWLQNDGANWQQISNAKGDAGVSIVGDIKNGVQSSDHSGWYVLNGRAVSTLSITAQAAAVSLGFSGNIPNADNRVLKHPTGSQAIGTTGGATSTTLSQSNLPNVNFPTSTTSSNGSHTHTFSRQANAQPVYYSYDDNLTFYNESGTTTTSSAGNHTHTVTVNSGGSGTSFERYQPYLVVNTFIYLGL